MPIRPPVLTCLIAALVWLVSPPAAAKLAPKAGPTTPERTFEVASVKANRSGITSFGAFGPQPGGQWVMLNGTVRLLIGYGYVPGQSDVEGLPGWVDTERYDVQAKADGHVSVFTAVQEQWGLKARS